MSMPHRHGRLVARAGLQSLFRGLPLRCTTRFRGDLDESSGFLVQSLEQHVGQTIEVHVIGTIPQSPANRFESG